MCDVNVGVLLYSSVPSMLLLSFIQAGGDQGLAHSDTLLFTSSALVHRPELIVVDEPMVGLDPKSARLLKDLFREFVDRGGTVLMSTHTLEVAESMCDRIGIIQGGRIVACGTMDELRVQHAAGDASLEDLFLRLTGGTAERELGVVFES